MQNLEVNASRKVELPDEIWLKIIQNLPTNLNSPRVVTPDNCILYMIMFPLVIL